MALLVFLAAAARARVVAADFFGVPGNGSRLRIGTLRGERHGLLHFIIDTEIAGFRML